MKYDTDNNELREKYIFQITKCILPSLLENKRKK